MFDAIELPAGVAWSVMVEDHSGGVLFEQSPDLVCATASIGKTLLLITVADQLARGLISPSAVLSRESARPVADSGIWQHLDSDALPVADVCALVGAVSDNLATNVLIQRVGLASVQSTAEHLGLSRTALQDVVRDARMPEHPRALSTGTARELVALVCELVDPRVLNPRTARQVVQWLSLNTDLSMVAGAFGLDPLAHGGTDRGVRLWNKTGTTAGARCDIGAVTMSARQLVWAVLANWTVLDDRDGIRDEVLAAMGRIGSAIRQHLAGGE
jgi:beta-lactamase class A